jgi:chaperonin GroES
VNIRSEDIDPRYDRCLVKLIFDEKIRGIIVPEKAKANAKFVLAQILAVGEGRVTDRNEIIPLRVKPGDYVLIEKTAGFPLSLEDGLFLLISEMHVLTSVRYREPSLIQVVS